MNKSVEQSDGDVTVHVGRLGCASEDKGDARSRDENCESLGGFYVADDGPGIPEGERERIFEASYTTEADNIGLGLTFIRQLAEAYGWECVVTDSDGGGARFEFRNIELAS